MKVGRQIYKVQVINHFYLTEKICQIPLNTTLTFSSLKDKMHVCTLRDPERTGDKQLLWVDQHIGDQITVTTSCMES
jgi:hypothetical protein